MKFIIEKEVLLDNLQKVLGPTTTKQNFPTLGNVLISTIDNKLKFTTTDLDITIISLQERVEIVEKNKMSLPMKRFITIIRELPSQKIILETTQNNLLIKCENIEFKINIANPQEFPKIEEEKGMSLIKINPQDLGAMIELTAFCVGYEDTNYVLNGILFELTEDKISLVSTDGKRLSFIEKKLPPNQSRINPRASFILPIKAVNELYKLIKEREKEIFLFVKENRVGFEFKDVQFIARPIEGEFPNYSQYIPQESKDKLIINRRDFLLALRRANLLSTLDYQGVKLELKKESVVISKITPQLGEAKEIVNATYSGAPLEIGFNPGYLIDVLKNLEDEEVIFDFFGTDKPAILRKENYLYLILPMKI